MTPFHEKRGVARINVLKKMMCLIVPMDCTVLLGFIYTYIYIYIYPVLRKYIKISSVTVMSQREMTPFPLKRGEFRHKKTPF